MATATDYMAEDHLVEEMKLAPPRSLLRALQKALTDEELLWLTQELNSFTSPAHRDIL